MAVTLNAKGTSTSSFIVGKDGTTITQGGGISPPADTDLTISLDEDQYLTVDAGLTGPALITSTDDQDIHINPAVGGGQYLILVGSRWPVVDGTVNQVLATNGAGILNWTTLPGIGTVTSVAATGNNGITVSGSPITSNGTITLGLGAITPTSVAASGAVSGSNLSGTNTGDQTITLTGDVTGSGTGSFATTLATVNGSPQTDTFRKVTVNAKGLVTATTAVSSSDLTTALGYTPVNRAGDTMTGPLTTTALIPSGATIPTNGVYLPAANSVGISTATTERLRINSNGAVTISAPSAAPGQSPLKIINSDNDEPTVIFDTTLAGVTSGLMFSRAGVVQSFIGSAGTAGSLVSDSSIGDYVIRATGAPLRLAVSAAQSALVITADRRVYGTGLHNNGDVSGLAQQFIASGTYTPVFGNGVNIQSTQALSAAWVRTGNVVQVSGSFQLDPLSSGVITSFTMTLPIPVASNLSICAGVCTRDPNTPNLTACIRPFFDQAQFAVNQDAFGGNASWFYTFSYLIV